MKCRIKDTTRTVFKSKYVRVELTGLLEGLGSSSFEQQATSTLSGGIGRDRCAVCILTELHDGDAALGHQQSVELNNMKAGMYRLDGVNPAVLKAASLDVHCPEQLPALMMNSLV